jgi:hypothetical protein
VGIGTDSSDKTLKVAGDAMFLNTSDDTYFYIEEETTGVKSVGAYEEPGTWRTLKIDGLELHLNTLSNGYIHLPLLSSPPPAVDCDEPSECGRMIVDKAAGSLYICVDSGWVEK